MTVAHRHIPITRPVVGEAEAEAARRPIKSGWLTQGPEVAAFEREFAALVGAPHACAVSNCTTALHLALLASGILPGDEVITVSHSFIATANAVRYCGAIPVFVDVERTRMNMDVSLVEGLITPRTRAILCVHQLGMPCDVLALVALARRYDLRVVEDAACAVGSQIRSNGKWEMIGRPHADIACFSFHPRELITTGDGGMITTGRADWDARFRLWRQHGLSVPDTVRHQATEVVFESHTQLGFNYRLTDLQAAVGREQLKRLPGILARRRSLAARYHDLLGQVPGGMGLPREPSWGKSNWQSYCVRLPAGCDQRVVMQEMLDRGVATRRGVMCAHREKAYRQEPWRCGEDRSRCRCSPGHCRRLGESERAQDETILLPLFPGMTEEEQDAVVADLVAALSVAAGHRMAFGSASRPV